jgi:hypothetical protein
VLGKSGPLVSIPNSNQAKSTADVRGSPARGKQLVDRTVQLTTEVVHYEGVLARAMRLPILTVIEEGIAERGVIEHPVKIPEKEDESWTHGDDFNSHFNAWLAKLRKRHAVFLGYCSKAQDIVDAVDTHLSKLGLSVRNWRTELQLWT